MEEPYWWYVLYVRANTERRVIEDVLRFFNRRFNEAYELDAFCPESERYMRNVKNRILGKKYIRVPLFPNYVFIETNMPSDVFIREFSQLVHMSTDIIRILRYGDSDIIAISLEERRRFEYLLRDKRCIEHSEGFIEGDKVVVTGGSIVGMEGYIKYINRHNHKAWLEIDMFGNKTQVEVVLEIVRKV